MIAEGRPAIAPGRPLPGGGQNREKAIAIRRWRQESARMQATQLKVPVGKSKREFPFNRRGRVETIQALNEISVDIYDGKRQSTMEALAQNDWPFPKQRNSSAPRVRTCRRKCTDMGSRADDCETACSKNAVRFSANALIK